ncbi:MAG: diguanylate cyclase [Magnetococcus sp. THC-1_WYH]
MKIQFFKIKHRFAALFVILLGLSTGIIGWFSFEKTEEAVIASALSIMHDDLEHVYSQCEMFHDRARSTMGIALENPAFKEYFSLPETKAGNRYDSNHHLILTPEQQVLQGRLDDWTYALQKRFPIVETCLIDTTGQEHTRTTHRHKAPLADMSPNEGDASFFKPTFQLPPGEVYLAEPYMSADAKEWVFAYTSPVVLDDGSKPAFYHFEIPLAFFKQFVMQNSPEAEKTSQALQKKDSLSDRFIILTAQGLIVVDNHREINFSLKPGKGADEPALLQDYLPKIDTLSDHPDFLSLMQQARNGDENHGSFTVDGERYFVTYKPLPVLGWSLVRIKSYNALLKGNISLTNIRNVIIAVALGVLMLGFTIVWIVSSWITRPLSRLSIAMEALQNGRECVDVTANTQDELGQIVGHFNHMRREIEKNRDFLIQERNKLTTIIHSTQEGVVVADGKDTVVLVNPAAERLLGKTTEQIAQGGFFALLDDPEYIRAVIAGDKFGSMADIVVFNQLVLNFYASKFLNAEGEKIGSAALMRDITREKKLEEELRSLSFTDKLTGLLNRRWLEDSMPVEFSRALRYGLNLSVLFFDVDHFKKFNDTHGHDMGDLVLRTIGETLRTMFRQTDFSCRFGGEEFCVLLTNTGADQACIVAEKLRKKVEATQIQNMRVTISIGVASNPLANTNDDKALLKLADNALYAAKKLGRNQVVRWDQIK